MENLNQESWRERLGQAGDAVILDVRTPNEVAEGIIPEAINLNLLDGAEFMTGINGLDPSKSYFVYCRSGARSEQACLIMKSSGFRNTFNLLGGMLQWEGEVT